MAGRVILAMGGLAVMAAGQARAAEFIGHQALYRISLQSAASRSGVVSARGAVLYRFADACDGWTAENRTLLRLGYDEGGEDESEWSQISWEAKDGSAFRFRVRDVSNGELSDEFEGHAVLAKDGGTAEFIHPDRVERKLPAGTLFPTHHLMALLEAARNGRHRVSNVLFDGASLDGPYSVGAVFGKAPDKVALVLARKAKLKDLSAWDMRLAFFPLADVKALPKFEIGMTFREDGVAGDIIQDFGDFVLRLTLQHLEILPAPDC